LQCNEKIDVKCLENDSNGRAQVERARYSLLRVEIVELGMVFGSALLTFGGFDSPSNSPESSSAHLSKRERILLGESKAVNNDSEDQHQLQAVYCGRLLEVRYGINCSSNIATANLPCSCIEACILYHSLDQLPHRRKEVVSIDALKTIGPERFCPK
jgi:hypothetical protein